MQEEMVAWQPRRPARLHVRKVKTAEPAQRTLSICAKARLMYMTAVLPSHRVTLNSAPIGRIALTYTCARGAACAYVTMLQHVPSLHIEHWRLTLASGERRRTCTQRVAWISCC